MSIGKDSIVTVDLNNQSSNTFIVDTVEETHYLLSHPLASGILIRVPKNKVNKTNANIKDSSERAIDYANGNREYLDYNTAADLESLAIFFTIKRKLTPRQKQTLASICGVIASVKFDNDLRDAMNFVTKNSSLLDEFNMMWYNNFKGLFSGQQMVTSKKQRSAIFNIAGYVLAEMENPTANRRK
jgi:hypothetical protein